MQAKFFSPVAMASLFLLASPLSPVFSSSFAFAETGDDASSSPDASPSHQRTAVSPADRKLVEDFVAQHRSENIAERIDAASRALFNLPFSWFPLGEGERGEFDRRPLYRFDTFDCSTWVETVMALGLARSFEDFQARMNGLRYHRGVISFQTRNHFPDVDWIENNEKSGIIRDVTEEVAGSIPLRVSNIQNSRRLWYSKLSDERIFLPAASKQEQRQKLGQLRRLVENDTPIRSSLSYIPFEAILVPKEKAHLYSPGDLRPLRLKSPPKADYPRHPGEYLVNSALLSRIPTPALIQVIKPGWDRKAEMGIVFNIGHRGILSRRNDELFFQQMSLRLKRSVELSLEEDLFYRLVDPPVKGFNFYEIKDPRL